MDQPEIETLLTEVVTEHGGRLVVDERRPTVGPVPVAGGARGACPRCGGDQFLYEFGDINCVCVGCASVLDVDDLESVAG